MISTHGFRCGCHGLHVDTGRFGKGSEHCSREDRVCLVCMSGSVEGEHHFLFDCPAYSHIHQQYSHLFPSRFVFSSRFSGY
jgi:hypothetical protein